MELIGVYDANPQGINKMLKKEEPHDVLLREEEQQRFSPKCLLDDKALTLSNHV